MRWGQSHGNRVGTSGSETEREEYEALKKKFQKAEETCETEKALAATTKELKEIKALVQKSYVNGDHVPYEITDRLGITSQPARIILRISGSRG